MDYYKRPVNYFATSDQLIRIGSNSREDYGIIMTPVVLLSITWASVNGWLSFIVVIKSYFFRMHFKISGVLDPIVTV